MTAATTVVVFVDCPDCDGYGATAVRLIGRRMVEPVTETPCTGCHGTGLAPSDQVVTCDVCTGRFWAGDACSHDDRAMCPDCTSCSDCSHEARSEAGYDALREGLLGRPLVGGEW